MGLRPWGISIGRLKTHGAAGWFPKCLNLKWPGLNLTCFRMLYCGFRADSTVPPEWFIYSMDLQVKSITGILLSTLKLINVF